MTEEESRSAAHALLMHCTSIALTRTANPSMDDVAIVLREEAEKIISKLIRPEQDYLLPPADVSDFSSVEITGE